MRFHAILCASIVLGLSAGAVRAADRYWVAASTANFSATSSWSTTSGGSGGASVPGSSDIAHWDSHGAGNTTVDTTVSAAGFDIGAGYAGAISQGSNTITIGSSNFSLAGGTFTGGSGNLTVNGTFSQSGGTFTAPSGAFSCNSDFTISHGTFTPGGNTVTFSGTGNQAVDVGMDQYMSGISVTNTGGIVTFNTWRWTCDSLTASAGAQIYGLATARLTVSTNLTLSGTMANPIVFQSTEGYTSFNLRYNGGTQTLSWVQFKEINNGNGNRLYATNNCTDNGGNVNFDFGDTPIVDYMTSNASDLTTVRVRYNQQMSTTQATDPTNYSASGGLTVNTAAISTDLFLVTLTLSGNVTLGTTTVTASNAIKSRSQNFLATTTMTVVSGNSNGIPDSVGAVTLSLSTDSNQSLILDEGQSFTLTVTAPGSSATTVGIGQQLESGGSSRVYFGSSGTATSGSVTTSGGGTNTATILLRGDVDGSFWNDGTLRAYITSNTDERATHFFTTVHLAISPTCGFNADQRPTNIKATMTPAVQNAQILTTAFVDLANPSVASVGGTCGTLLTPPQFPLTASDGTATVAYQPGPGDIYLGVNSLVFTASFTDNTGTGHRTDWTQPDPCKGGGPPDSEPDNTTGSYSTCPNVDPAYKGGSGSPGASGGSGQPTNSTGATNNSTCSKCNSIDPSDGEDKRDITDLTIPGRGMNYAFRRVYRGYNYLQDTVNHRDFGENWTYSYADDYLIMDGDPATDPPIIHAQEGQGGAVFVYVGTVGAWLPPRENFEQITRNFNVSPFTFERRDSHGNVHVYTNFSSATTPNINGRLQSVRDRNGNTMTFHYDQIDPDGTGLNDKFVLSWVNDTMGREIRYQYYASASQTISGRVVTIVNSNTAAYGRLATVVDFKDNMTFSATPTQTQDFSGQARNRTLTFDYDADGNLARCSSPVVAATPMGNDFSSGKTTRYKYILGSDLSTLVSGWAGFTSAQQAVISKLLKHKLIEVWYANEVQGTPGSNPADSAAAEVLTYNTTASFTPTTSPFLTAGTFLGFISTYTISGTNGNNVPAGGTISYAFTDLDSGRGSSGGVAGDYTILLEKQSLKCVITDRNGNQCQAIYGAGKTMLDYRIFPAGFRASEPAAYITTYHHNKDRMLKSRTMPESNFKTLTYNETNSDYFQEGNRIRTVETPDVARGGDQPTIERVWVYEPVYNHASMIIQARGSNMTGNGFTPPVSDPASRTMTDPYDGSRTLNMRYATVNYFDYQESTLKASAATTTPNRNGSGYVSSSPLITYDSNVLATEVLLVQELGLPEDTSGAGLVTLRARLSANLISLGLGDLNGDGNADPVVNGNIIRTIVASPVLLANLNQTSLENTISANDLIDHGKTYANGGPNEGSSAARLQTTVTMYQYNALGQLTKTISPEGNVNTMAYFPETAPSGNGVSTPTPADGRTLNSSFGGYLQETVADTTRSYYQQTTGTLLSGGFSDNDTNPSITSITSSFVYDNVGNMKSMTNPRGIRADYFVNELNQVVQIKRAADISGASADPLYGASVGPLTAYAYLSLRYFDFNNNVVLSEVEDRGNTSNVGGQGFSASSQDTATTPGLSSADGGSTAFADTLMEYDRLNDVIATQGETNGTTALTTRFRYDPNQNRVLTIYPAGNADGAVFDERDLLFQRVRGVSTRPSAGNYASGDPTTFNRPGGSGTTASTFTMNYDLNRNLIESVDAVSNGGNTSSISGAGDVTAFTYDGYDRRKTTTDALGNVTTFVYDPDSNVVRTIQNGDPVDDTHSSSNIGKTLSVTERIFDERSRVICSHKVLFQTPVASPQRTPTLTNNSTVAGLAAYLSDASSNNASVPGASGITVIGRMVSLFEYDRQSRKCFEVHDDIDCRSFAYDGASRTIETIDGVTNNGFSGGSFTPANIAGNLVDMAYDNNSNVIERKETDVTTVSSVANEIFHTTNFYDSLDRLQTTVSNIGQAEDYRYDSRNNLVAKADAVGASATARSYNRRGLGSTSSVSVNNFGNVSRTRYDGQSRTLETESILTSGHTGDGTHIGADITGVQTMTSGDVNYSDCPTPDTGEAGDGVISVYYCWDNNSQLLGLKDDNGNTTAYIYDNQNRTLTERKGLNPSGTSLSVSGGDSGSFDQALRGGVSIVDTEASGTDNTFTYDADSNMLTLENEGDISGNRSTLTYTYDALMRRKTLSVSNPGGSAFIGTLNQTWKYDGMSRLTQCTDDNDGTSGTLVTCKYFYDSLSRKVEEQQQIGSNGYKAYSCSYDGVCDCAGSAVPSSCFYPDGRQVDNVYDDDERLISRTDHGQSSAIGTYAYIGKWRVATLTYENNTRLTHIGQVSSANADTGFDTLRRVVDHRWESFTSQALGNGTQVVEFGYQDGSGNPNYDRANNKLIEEKRHDTGNSEVYSYDSAYRVNTFNRGTLNGGKTAISTATTITGALQAQTFTLDGLGNWSTNVHTEGGTANTENRTHSDFNEIVAVSGTPYAGGTTGTQLLDKDGNITDDLTKTYKWDALNRLREVRDKGTGNLLGTYFYNCSNRRIQKVVTNSGSLNGTTSFYYDGWRVMEEHDGSDNDLRQYTYGNYLDEVWTLDNRAGGITIAQLNAGTGSHRLFYHQNTLYSVFALTDETGAIVEGYMYDAYGRQSVDTSSGSDSTWFTSDDAWTVGGNSAVGNPYMGNGGYRFDPESGNYVTPYRYYNSGLGRWLSRDSAPSNADNLYEYVNSGVTTFLDRLGLYGSGIAPEIPLADPNHTLGSDDYDYSWGLPCGNACCCCPTSMELSPREKTTWGFTYTIKIELDYLSSYTGHDCKLEWWEKSDHPAKDPHKKPNEWWNGMARGNLVHVGWGNEVAGTFGPWFNRKKPCPGSEPVSLTDPTESMGQARFLKIAVHLISGCSSCPDKWIWLTLTWANFKPNEESPTMDSSDLPPGSPTPPAPPVKKP